MKMERTQAERYIQQKYLGKALCDTVEHMDAAQLGDLITLIMARLRQLQPDTDFIWISLPKYDEARRRDALAQVWELMEKGTQAYQEEIRRSDEKE